MGDKYDNEIKRKIIKPVIRPAMIYVSECWTSKYEYDQKMKVAEMRMLRWMSGY